MGFSPIDQDRWVVDVGGDAHQYGQVLTYPEYLRDAEVALKMEAAAEEEAALGKKGPLSKAVGKGKAFAFRTQILFNTLFRTNTAEQRELYRGIAAENLHRWAEAASSSSSPIDLDAPARALPIYRVVEGDWGDTVAEETKLHGAQFVALNAANAHSVGGHYVKGTPAAEENMARRTLLHYLTTRDEMREGAQGVYTEEMKSRIYGQVAFGNPISPNVCLRGKEAVPASKAVAGDVVSEGGLVAGYRWMEEEEVGFDPGD